MTKHIYKGKSAREWAEKLGISPAALTYRMKEMNLSFAQAVEMGGKSKSGRKRKALTRSDQPKQKNDSPNITFSSGSESPKASRSSKEKCQLRKRLQDVFDKRAEDELFKSLEVA